MAHPTQAFPKQFALINGAETVTADIFAIQVIASTAVTVDVKAAGIFEQLGANGSDGSTHLANADTPDAQRTGNNLNTTHDAGFYERRRKHHLRRFQICNRRFGTSDFVLPQVIQINNLI